MDVRIEDREGTPFGDSYPFVVHTTGSFPVFEGFRDPEARVEWMDDNDVDYTLASVSTPNPNEGPFSVDQSTELIRAINDGLADVEAAYPDRFGGLGPLPLRDPEAALEELDRIVDMGLAGVALPTTVRGRKLSHPDLEPVFDRLDELDLTAFVHPGRNALSHELDDEEWMFTPMTVFTTETTHQIGRLVFDGFFDRHDFDVVLSHMGGALTHLVGRMERGREQFRSGDGDSPERPVIEYLREFHYDTISFHPPAMEAAMETVGADRLLFGTDYPFGMEKIEDTLADVEELSLSPAEREAVTGGTAAALFDL
jgi:aminocarboxymuconate-semialdehyde decarboxylase